MFNISWLIEIQAQKIVSAIHPNCELVGQNQAIIPQRVIASL